VKQDVTNQSSSSSSSSTTRFTDEEEEANKKRFYDADDSEQVKKIVDDFESNYLATSLETSVSAEGLLISSFTKGNWTKRKEIRGTTCKYSSRGGCICFEI
jgi:hypothetical protein